MFGRMVFILAEFHRLVESVSRCKMKLFWQLVETSHTSLQHLMFFSALGLPSAHHQLSDTTISSTNKV